MSGTFLYPNVGGLTGGAGINPSERKPQKPEGVAGEFDQVLGKELGKPGEALDLNHVKAPLKFSTHASQRLKDRKIALDPATMTKVTDAIDKAAAKGIEDSLILTKDAALIVSVKNRTVITALDRDAMSGNVFTNIDGAVII
jgi:flagellar operon protein